MTQASLTPSEFFATVFAGRKRDEKILIGHPASWTDNGVEKHYYKQLWFHDNMRLDPELPWVYTVSTVRRGDSPRRRVATDTLRAYVVVLDDIGNLDKVPNPPELEPHYVMETSEGNYQWGYLIEPYKTSTVAGAARYDGCLRALAKAGMNDKGAIGAHRMVKVVGARHKSGFITTLREWRPEKPRWELMDLMDALGVEPMLGNGGHGGQKGAVGNLDEVSDDVLDWLDENGMVHGRSGEWVFIPCPWADGHTSGDDMAGYSPFKLGFKSRAFNCFHGHCNEHGTYDFLEWVADNGGPDKNPRGEAVNLKALSALDRLMGYPTDDETAEGQGDT